MKRTTWIVLAAFVLLLTAFLVDQNVEPALMETPVPTAQPALRNLDDQDIQSITYVDADNTSIILEKEGELTWISPTDPDATLSAGNIEELIANLSELTVLATMTQNISLSDLWLDEPVFTVKFIFEDDGSAYFIEIGNVTPFGDGYYARIDRGEIVVLPADSISQVRSIFLDFITDPTPTPSSPSDS